MLELMLVNAFLGDSTDLVLISFAQFGNPFLGKILLVGKFVSAFQCPHQSTTAALKCQLLNLMVKSDVL